MTTSNDTELIEVSDAAVQKALSLLEQQSASGRPLRVFAQDGGHAGWQFGMAIAEAPDADDVIFERGGLTFLIDPQSAPLVRGAQIDFVEDVMRSGFTITNPNLVNTGGGCGCGGGGCGCGGGGGQGHGGGHGHGGDFEERCC